MSLLLNTHTRTRTPVPAPVQKTRRGDWHRNHQRVYWHHIQLFVDAEHSRGFIFMRRISSVTCSERIRAQGALLAVEAHQSVQIITPVAIMDGSARKQLSLEITKKKTKPSSLRQNKCGTFSSLLSSANSPFSLYLFLWVRPFCIAACALF